MNIRTENKKKREMKRWTYRFMCRDLGKRWSWKRRKKVG